MAGAERSTPPFSFTGHYEALLSHGYVVCFAKQTAYSSRSAHGEQELLLLVSPWHLPSLNFWVKQTTRIFKFCSLYFILQLLQTNGKPLTLGSLVLGMSWTY